MSITKVWKSFELCKDDSGLLCARVEIDNEIGKGTFILRETDSGLDIIVPAISSDPIAYLDFFYAAQPFDPVSRSNLRNEGEIVGLHVYDSRVDDDTALAVRWLPGILHVELDREVVGMQDSQDSFYDYYRSEIREEETKQD